MLLIPILRCLLVGTHMLFHRSPGIYSMTYSFFFFWGGRFHALLASAEWSFVLCWLPSCVWWCCCGEGFLVSECIGRDPLLSSSTGRVGVVGDFEEGFSAVALVCGISGRGWALWACKFPSRLSSRVGVLFRHLIHMVAPACVTSRIFSFFAACAYS